MWCRVRRLARNRAGSDAKRQFYGSIRTGGHFVDIIYTRPPHGIATQEEERKRVQYLGRGLTWPGNRVVGKPLEEATAEDLDALRAAQLPVAGIDPGGGAGGRVVLTADIARGEAVGHTPGIGPVYLRSDQEKVVRWTTAKWAHETRSAVHTRARAKLMATDAAAGLRAAHEAGSSKTASLDRFLEYIAALYPHLPTAHAFACRPNGLLRLRFRRHQDNERAWQTLIRSITGGTRDIIIGFGNASIGNQLGGHPHGLVQEARRHLQAWVGAARFFSVKEDRTSLTCSRCHGEVGLLYKRRLRRTLHAVTRCKDHRCGCIWNRDTNAARNIRHIVIVRILDPAAPRPAPFIKRRRQWHGGAATGAAAAALG